MNRQPSPCTRFLGALACLCLLICQTTPALADSQATYLQCLTNFETYAESIWHSASYANAPADAGYWGDGGSSGNGGIRGNGGVALAYAVLVIAYPSDPKVATRLARIRQALNFNAGSHVTGTNVCTDGHQWGYSSPTSTDWQTPEWTGSMGLACVLVQNQLPAAVVQAVQNVVAAEATHRSAIGPASGWVSDTKAEENGWDSNTPTLAAAWLSTNANAGSWLTGAKKYLANSYTVAKTNADPLASWVSTVTLYPDFALDNDGFYHPTYQMVAGMSEGDSLLMARRSNPAIATQLVAFAEHNVLNVWTNESHVVLDSGEFAAPAGLDWELHDYEQNSYLAWLASHFNDPIARWEDNQLAQLVRYRQIVNGNGMFVGPSVSGGAGDPFFREAVEARRTAIAWLHWAGADFPTGPSSVPGPAFEYLPDVGIIAQRGPFGFTSLCFGPQTNGSAARIMATIEPPALGFPTNAYVTTPRLPGIIGLGALGIPTRGRVISLVTNANGFQAELQLTNGANGTTEVYFTCTGETIGLVEVPWPTTTVGGASGSFCVGIENDPLIGGSRLLEWTGGSASLTNRTGVTLNISNDWVCVAGHYGMAAGPAGYFNYQAASSYNRAGAAEDTLQFMTQSPLAARYAVWFPGQTAAQTASNASQITWTAAGTNGVLTFPGLGGSPAQISVTLPGAPPPYAPYAVSADSITASSTQSPSFPASNAVDGLLTDFWVSLYGPTNHAEWLKVTFARAVALSEFQVYPRTDNGGYGPRGVQMVLNVTNNLPASGLPSSGSNVFSGTMAPTSTLDVTLPAPVPATNAVLVITSSYDRGSTVNPRNTQVVELVFFERALPGTFGDWVLHRFDAAQVADPGVSGPLADPDSDGVPNLVEFAMGGNPLAADALLASLQPLPAAGGNLVFRYRERKSLGDVHRDFERSSDLANWSLVAPTLSNVADLGDFWLREAALPVQSAPGYFRLRFYLNP